MPVPVVILRANDGCERHQAHVGPWSGTDRYVPEELATVAREPAAATSRLR